MHQRDIAIVGGCGHVGLPLGLVLAQAGHRVRLVDVNEHAISLINDGKVPFLERGAEAILKKVVGKDLIATSGVDAVCKSGIVFFVTGTPVDEHHNPRVQDVVAVINQYLPCLKPETLVILRSTVYPDVVAIVDHILKAKFGTSRLAFCPERIVQGNGIDEIVRIPQIVSATSEDAQRGAEELFLTIAPKVIRLEPEEAELAKLITNAWRYLEFAAANQFYMMLESKGIDFYKVFSAIREDYPRAQHLPTAGLTAGPCLFKDTMQLSAFYKNSYFLGHAAMLINEGLPVFLVEQMERKIGSLRNKKIAILGMTFKANSDDIRESLAFKLKKKLEIKMAIVLQSDVYLANTMSLHDAIEQADGIILGAPHKEYEGLRISKPVVDCWGMWKRPTP